MNKVFGIKWVRGAVHSHTFGSHPPHYSHLLTFLHTHESPLAFLCTTALYSFFCNVSSASLPHPIMAVPVILPTATNTTLF